MDELLDMITADESPSQISDKIKDILFSKASGRVDSFKDYVGNSIFGEVETEKNIDDFEGE